MLDEMRMRTACFARAPQRCTIHLSKHFLFTFQEVTPLSKTRNQLIRMVVLYLDQPNFPPQGFQWRYRVVQG